LVSRSDVAAVVACPDDEDEDDDFNDTWSHLMHASTSGVFPSRSTMFAIVLAIVLAAVEEAVAVVVVLVESSVSLTLSLGRVPAMSTVEAAKAGAAGA
jgi:hypothetical protein